MQTHNSISYRRVAIIQYEKQEAAAKAIKGFNNFRFTSQVLTVRHFDQAKYAHADHVLLPDVFCCQHRSFLHFISAYDFRIQYLLTQHSHSSLLAGLSPGTPSKKPPGIAPKCRGIQAIY